MNEVLSGDCKVSDVDWYKVAEETMKRFNESVDITPLFTYANVDGHEGWINLFFKNRCIGMINDPELTEDVKKYIKELV